MLFSFCLIYFDQALSGIVGTIALATALILEKIIPRQSSLGPSEDVFKCFIFSCLNPCLIGLVTVFAFWLFPDGFGLNWAPGLNKLNPFFQGICVLFVFDLRSYWVHRWSHRWRFLWRFHRVHHMTREMNVFAHSPAHPLEYSFNIFSMLLLVMFLDVSWEVFYYGYTLPNILITGAWTHGNINWPRNGHNWLSRIINTPKMHGIHHSREIKNLNFGDIFVFWDLIFGTFGTVDSMDELSFGLKEECLSELSFGEILKSPFVKVRRRPI
jgi:sterol desaturase/sphingolipid hydroxylase (fatty acid hydroxylase superfamily)